MEVKANVRQRRQERIKSLQNDHRAEPMPRISLPEAEPPTAADERWSDPEFVWKMKQKQWLSSSGHRSSDDSEQGGSGGNRLVPSTRAIWLKLLASILGFMLVWGMFRLEHPWAYQGRQWVGAALTQDMPFTALAGWYERTFGGAPSFLPAFRGKKEQEAHRADSPQLKHFTVPVQGTLISSFSADQPWVVIQTSGEAPVYAMDTGRVEFAGYLEDTGYTVVIRHANGLQSTYGYLKANLWEENDWIEGGELLGKTGSGTGRWAEQLYFAVKKDEESIDPTEVVAFD